MTDERTRDFVTLDPSSGPLRARNPRSSASRPATLNGTTLALLSNGKRNAVELLEAIYDEISAQCDLAGVLRFEKESVSVPPRAEQFAQMVEEAGAVITAIGD